MQALCLLGMLLTLRLRQPVCPAISTLGYLADDCLTGYSPTAVGSVSGRPMCFLLGFE